MKKTVIFYISYKGNSNEGQRTHRFEFSIFKRKSYIVNKFFDWSTNQLAELAKQNSEVTIATNIKIIGL
jgi:hypothetical protein